MSNVDIQSLLDHLRATAAGAQQGGQRTEQSREGSAETSFAALLERSLAGVNQAQQTSASLSEAFQRGAPGVDLADVMIAGQKADVAFKAAVEVRNRVVDAYQEIMRMGI
jgi:flagellar hook-basal body complex protein FliE